MSLVRRVFVEKKSGFDVEAKHLLHDITGFLGIKSVNKVRVLARYDVQGMEEENFKKSLSTVFSEPNVDTVCLENFHMSENEISFATEYLPGQYDQRADSAAQAIQMITHKDAPIVKTAKVIVLDGDVSSDEIEMIKKFIINPVDSHEASPEKPTTLATEVSVPDDVAIIDNFIDMSKDELGLKLNELGLAMSMADFLHCQKYFRDEEKRNPTITEIKMLDTYWSDHCRHTTFLTHINRVEFEDGKFTKPIRKAYEEYLEDREFIYADDKKPKSLMDIALAGMKKLRKEGKLPELEASREINACSIIVDAVMDDGSVEPWLVMFKNETHNHPTEIEPFGGAATCLGGAIRDPLSGRSYVYQAMRVTGAADPRKPLSETLPGKLPQRKITTEAAHGYSSYGNQIGLATGIVDEIYDPDYVAKRMEIGAVIAATPKENVFRGEPATGDIVVLVGGRTGRDGCGGATGSSKKHTEESISTGGAEVQKGNPPTERKIQRLFRNPVVSKMIKVCNDFGAGGVSVAIGEIADGLTIDLDAVPKKYDGLDGTELAISESQERMAVLLDPKDVESFIKFSEDENLEAVKVAEITDRGRVEIFWRGNKIVDLSREFIDTNGDIESADVFVSAPSDESPLTGFTLYEDLKSKWIEVLSDLNVCSKRGLAERFDSTIGASSVLIPFGGKFKVTPAEAMVAKLPSIEKNSLTSTIMAYGFNVEMAKWSPFHSAMYAVIDSVSKVVATGGDYKKVYLTLQEYFEKLGSDAKRWGKPFAALLGALTAQKELSAAAIGGKDSMSGSFEDLDVPPTLVSFAVAYEHVDNIISPEFKKSGDNVILFSVDYDQNGMVDFEQLRKNYDTIHSLILDGKIIASHTVGYGGIASALSIMGFGNMLGVEVDSGAVADLDIFAPRSGSILCEVTDEFDTSNCSCRLIGKIVTDSVIKVGGADIELSDALSAWEDTLEDVFPINAEEPSGTPEKITYRERNTKRPSVKRASPRVFIPVFPGTNCEYDTEKRFVNAGATVDTFVFNNMTPSHIDNSIKEMKKRIDNAQIIMIPGGFSAGDEPEGSGKFIASVFRNPSVAESVMKLLNQRDGLVLGICNGFQALVKLGLVPYGEIRELDETSPTLTFNIIGRHQSQIVNTAISSTLSPWFANVEVEDVHSIAISHGEGRFIATEDILRQLAENGQIATQYVDENGTPSYSIKYNPNGSIWAVEGVTSPDGRVLGKMGHSERMGYGVAKNIYGNKDQKIFESGVEYFM